MASRLQAKSIINKKISLFQIIESFPKVIIEILCFHRFFPRISIDNINFCNLKLIRSHHNEGNNYMER